MLTDCEFLSGSQWKAEIGNALGRKEEEDEDGDHKVYAACVSLPHATANLLIWIRDP